MEDGLRYKNKMQEWIPMLNNDYYFVNPLTGQIKNKYNKILKGRTLKINDKPKCIYYTIKTKKGFKSIKGHRIVAEAVLKKKLNGIIVGHKNGLHTDNRFKNLMINEKRNTSNRIQILEYKNKKINRRYTSIREFERETGISHKTFNGKEYRLGKFRLRVYED